MRYRVHLGGRNPTGRGAPIFGALAVATLALATLAGCATQRPPSPDRPAPRAPALHGLTVMVLPVQGGRIPAAPGLDSELAFWLDDLAPGVKWVFPPALERALTRSSALEVPIHTLAVSSVHYAQVERIGDPLYGDLRRAGAIVGARYALLPVRGGYTSGEVGGRVEIAAALIDTMGGGVLWFGVVAGERGGPDDPAVAASAARALARTLFPESHD
jgi:hypothetical protein